MKENIKTAAMVELEKLLDKGRDFLEEEEIRLKIEDLKMRTEKTIKENPLKAVALGLGIGFLIGKIIKSDK